MCFTGLNIGEILAESWMINVGFAFGMLHDLGFEAERTVLKMKILFITPGVTDDAFGGPKGSIRNYNSMKRYGNVHVYTFVRKSALRSILSILKGFYPPIDETDYKSIKELNDKYRFDLVFFDTSIYGKIIDIFKKAKTVVFFHNCEYDYNSVRFGKKFGIKKSIYLKSIFKNESYLVNNADYRIVFLKRDSDRMKLIYGKAADLIVPLGIDDKYLRKKRTNKKGKYCLLFGAVGTANVEGYRWFIENVAPDLQCKTVVAGKGFDKYSKTWGSEKVEVQGFVNDVESLYEDALMVVVPLFSGGGMKVKVVEALMYGKYIIGTNEAFAGFDINSSIMFKCNTSDEFINEINTFIRDGKNSFSEDSRNLYEEKYSIEATCCLFDKMMLDLGLKNSF